MVLRNLTSSFFRSNTGMAGISLAAAKARAESMHDTAVSGRRMELMSYDGRNIIE